MKITIDYFRETNMIKESTSSGGTVRSHPFTRKNTRTGQKSANVEQQRHTTIKLLKQLKQQGEIHDPHKEPLQGSCPPLIFTLPTPFDYSWRSYFQVQQ
jgi:hypothetical protein